MRDLLFLLIEYAIEVLSENTDFDRRVALYKALRTSVREAIRFVSSVLDEIEPETFRNHLSEFAGSVERELERLPPEPENPSHFATLGELTMRTASTLLFTSLDNIKPWMRT
ncbi:MAG: hypothetical protein DRP09_17535 [Candidatus Thorarchaeota archaeon]|nr:MAG: hypothetical protein DRP09_17535 [Candidatus Thorarchaeota archaeon]